MLMYVKFLKNLMDFTGLNVHAHVLCNLKCHGGSNAVRTFRPRTPETTWDTVWTSCAVLMMPPRKVHECTVTTVQYWCVKTESQSSQCCHMLPSTHQFACHLPAASCSHNTKGAPLLLKGVRRCIRSLRWQSGIPWWSCLHKQCPAVWARWWSSYLGSVVWHPCSTCSNPLFLIVSPDPQCWCNDLSYPEKPKTI